MDYKEHYRLDAEVFDYWGDYHFTPAETRRNQYIFNLAQIRAGEKVLDIGSGRGWFCLHAASRGAEVTALDLSEANLERIKQMDSRINTLLADAAEPDGLLEKYDLLVALEVLEHIVDPAKALEHWKNLLKPGGRLLITVPYKEQIQYSLCIHCNQKTPHNAHLHSFDKSILGALLVANGLRVIRVDLFAHKLGTHFRLDRFTRKLPYWIWRGLDRLYGLGGDKYNYLAVLCSLK